MSDTRASTTERADGPPAFALPADRVLDALYDTLGFARTLQSEMWVVACERFAELVGGRAIGPVEVTTERDG